MNMLYVLLPILILLLFFNNVEGFDYQDQTAENIIISESDNWCNCDKTCNFANVDSSDSEKVKNLEDTCDINYNFVGLEKTDDKKQDLINYCDGCIDILNTRCRSHPGPKKFDKVSTKDPIVALDNYCNYYQWPRSTGAGVVKRCDTDRTDVSKPLHKLIEYMGFGYGDHQILPCPANLNPYQRWPRQGKFARGTPTGSNIANGLPEIRQ